MGSWAIVGGGLLGSDLALRLADRGEDVTLFERAPSIGGLASAWRVGDISWDKFYHVTLASDSHTRGLLRRLGLEEEIRWVETKTGSWFGGKLYSMSNVIDYARFPPLSLWDKTRLAWTILNGAFSRDWKRLEQIPVETWLRTKSGAKVFDQFWLPLLEAKLGDAYTDTSAAYIWATIQRLYAARRTGMKTEQFGYVPGGYRRILEHLGTALVDNGCDVRLGARVEAIAPGPIVRVDGEDTRYDRVVVTTPPPVTAEMVEGLTQTEIERLRSIRYQGIVCATVLTKGPVSGFYLTYLHDPAPFTGVIEMSAFVDPQEFGGRGLFYLPKYCAPDDPLFDESDESLKATFLPALAKIFPSFHPDDVLAFEVARARNVFPVATLGYSEQVPDFDTSVPGVHLVSSAQIVNGTLNVNETLQLSDRAIHHLAALDESTIV